MNKTLKRISKEFLVAKCHYEYTLFCIKYKCVYRKMGRLLKSVREQYAMLGRVILHVLARDQGAWTKKPQQGVKGWWVGEKGVEAVWIACVSERMITITRLKTESDHSIDIHVVTNWTPFCLYMCIISFTTFSFDSFHFPHFDFKFADLKGKIRKYGHSGS